MLHDPFLLAKPMKPINSVALPAALHLYFAAPTGVAIRHTADDLSAYKKNHPVQVSKIGLGPAKNVFQVHGTTKDDAVALNCPCLWAQLLSFFSKLAP
ncbi:hypothetical protein PM02_00155 [Sulfitobacter mediterraneus]|uniref:Uncharacterized protein n=1 Tax=Sulfitobacter mediterraneus TaxID=83219 RepID=A0A061SXV7_9RHOB|nr:hypothetical protein PM02_00155 [Sulfitobacter mediterraneus]